MVILIKNMEVAMKASKRCTCCILIVVGSILLGGASSWAQLTTEWYQKTPDNENHTFREITINSSTQKLYITDLATDLVSIYENSANDELIGSFGGDVWEGANIGPYGISTADDEQIYTALWDYRDLNGDDLPDHSLWRCTPSGKHLVRVCYLPAPPRGIQAHGAGANTTVYVSGTDGKIIRCSAETPFRFTSEVLFETGIWANQQDVLVDKAESRMYVSSWTDDYGWTPYDSPVTKWTLDGVRDESFSTSYLPKGNVPALAFDASENAIYLLHISFAEDRFASIYKVDAMTGAEIDHVIVGEGGNNGGGGLVVDRKGDIYFSMALVWGSGPSAWGKVVDLQLDKKAMDNDTELTEPEIVTDYRLFQNNPNPFNPTTTINYTMAQNSHVKLTVYNMLGQVVAVLVNGFQKQGSYSVTWNAQDRPGGLYICRLEADGFSTTRRMLLQK
jgi:hypothetical protein